MGFSVDLSSVETFVHKCFEEFAGIFNGDRQSFEGQKQKNRCEQELAG
jgi:hypothetical protein